MLLRRERSVSTPITEELLYLLNYVIPVELARDREKNVIWLIACLPEVSQVLSLQRLDALRCAQGWTSERGTTVKAGACKVKDAAHWFIVAPANLL